MADPVIQVKQSELVLNTFAAIFQNNMMGADLVSWNELEGEMDDLNGNVVSEQVVPRYIAKRTKNGVADLTSGVQDTIFGSEQFSMDTTFNVSMGYGDYQKITTLGAARESKALEQCAVALAEDVDRYIMENLVTASNAWIGDAGATIDDPDEIASALTYLAEEGNADADVRAVLNFTDKQKLGEHIRGLTAPDAEVTKAIRKGFSGELQGIRTDFTQNLVQFRTGTRQNGAIAGAGQHTDYATVSRSAKNGWFLSQEINIDGVGANATAKKGDIFTIAGVFAYDQRKQASIGRLQQFTVVEDAVADGSGNMTVRIYPAMIVPNTVKLVSNNVDVNTAQATVDSIPADNAVVTWKGAANTLYMPRLLLTKDALRMDTQRLIMPFSDTSSNRKLNKIPATVRMWKWSDGTKGSHRIRFDVAMTANIKNRKNILRLNGVG